MRKICQQNSQVCNLIGDFSATSLPYLHGLLIRSPSEGFQKLGRFHRNRRRKISCSVELLPFPGPAKFKQIGF